MVAAAAVGAAVGGKLLYWASDPAFTASHWQDPTYLIGGKSIVGALRTEGFDPCAFVFTPQTGGRTQAARLCDEVR